MTDESWIPRERSRLALFAGVALVYFVAARLSLEFALVGSVVTPIWPPSGIALVALLRYGRTVWPAITLAAFAVNLPVAGGPAAAAVIALGNTVAPLLTWRLLEWTNFEQALERLRDSAILVGAGVACMTVSAAIGTSALLASGVITSGELLSTFAVWWAGDASGVLVFAPALLVLGKPLPKFRSRSGATVEAITLILGLALVSPFAFMSATHPSRYLIFPFLVWAAVRFGQVGAVLATVAVTLGAILAAVTSAGPFTEASLLERMLSLQTFNVSVATTAFVLASAIEERRKALRLMEAEQQLLYDMFVGVPAAVFVTRGRRHTVEFVNRDFADLVGGENLAGSPIGEFLPGRSVGAILDSVYESGEPESLTEAHVTPGEGADPGERFFNCTFQPLRGTGGRIQGVIGHLTDVTELVRARSQLESVAAERASIYRQEHEIAETLQRSLLPDRLPELRGLSLAARYLPGSAGIDVGGDWYDVFPMPIGRVALVVGDVIGRGLKAAAAMGQLRIALRAYAFDADDPAAVLSRLSSLLEDLPDVEMATVFLGIVDYGNESFRFASAGHPAPLLLRPDGTAVFLEGGRRPPLGVPMRGDPSAGVKLDPGSTLILYSDGLIEKRDRSIDDGMEKLKALVEQHYLELEPLCDRIIENLAGTAIDDVALLALRVATTVDAGLTLTIPADPKALNAARRALRQWLQRIGAGVQETEDLVLATNEAIANAIHHAYGPRTGSVLVEAEVADDRVVVVVSDQGRWKERPNRAGRGFQLMRSLVDDVEVERTTAGTRVRMVRRLGVNERGAQPLKFVDELPQPEVGWGAELVPVARVAKDLDLNSAAAVGRELDSLISTTGLGLIVDLSQAGFLDSAGLRLLFRVADELTKAGKRLSVVAPEGSPVRDTLELVLFDSVATVAGDVNSASQAFGRNATP